MSEVTLGILALTVFLIGMIIMWKSGVEGD